MRLPIAAAGVLLCVLCSGCGPFQLMSGGTIPAGKTKEQVQLDVLVCKDRAHIQSQTAADQARGFLLGFTFSVVGVAIDYQQQKIDQRRIFKECMESKGYSIQPATD